MKSYESDLLELAACIYSDAVAKCSGVTLNDRDLKTMRSRVKHEGLSFLTITLPTFGKELDISLSLGRIDPTFFRSFKKKGKAPAFLQGFFDHVFDETGRILDEPSVEAVEGIRQIAYAFKKLKVACSARRVRQAITKFSQSEHVFQEPIVPVDLQDFLRVSRCLWSAVFGGKDVLATCRPKHGPGATAEKLSGNAKYLMQKWHDRLESSFPVLDYAFANADARFSPEFQDVSIVAEAEEQPVRVIPVPKTLKTPRIIAIEPVCMQYTQQALSEQIIKLLESHRFTAGHVNFRDQSVNRCKAIVSSHDCKLATLDLSSASDLVPYELAIRMFDSNPDLQEAVSACRSTRAELPSGEILPLRKFASMGSALCFPIEAMYFYTCCVAALIKERNLPVTYPAIEQVVEHVYVYGDDIIVPTDESDVVIDTLHKYYCKVNVRKSFTSGNFRESCGMDAFLGEEVTPTYVRELPPDDKRSSKALVSWISTSNLFYKRGYWKSSSWLVDRLERIMGVLPIVGPKSSGLGKVSYQNAVSIERWGKRYHRPEVRAWTATPVYRHDDLDGYPALLKCLLTLERGDKSLTSEERYATSLEGLRDQVSLPKDPKHLERSARHGAVALKRRWVAPY